MIKQTQYNIADSNIANLGTELEKNVRKAAAEHEDAWKAIKKEPGIQVWRIQQFHVVPVPTEKYGTFYDGDSYIVLHAYKRANHELGYDVHFWLGTYTTQDEAGTAAYKTVELDDYLSGIPVQYREVQGFESERFLGYFPTGVRVLHGGVDSGFHHVQAKEHRNRLLQFKGKGANQVHVHEVALEAKLLNEGDAFVLDAGATIYQWNGTKANHDEKHKAATLANAIKAERNSGEVVVLEQQDDKTEHAKKFWSLLKGGPHDVTSAAQGGSDAVASKQHHEVLFRLSDASGKFEFSQVAESKGKPFSRSLLDSKDVFILNTGAEVFAWVGKGASVAEKRKALQFAQEYVLKAGLPPQTSVARILEGGENEVFESFFTK